MRFCLVVPSEFYEHFNQHKFEISGLLNWAPVMNGVVRRINDSDLPDYDVYMTNVSSTETEYISVLRQLNPEAKIVACFDYGFDIVNQYFLSMQRVKQVMDHADTIFSVNRNQVEWMKVLFPDRQVHYMPHPCDTQNVRKFRIPEKERQLSVAAMWHQYDNYQIQMLEVLKAVERRLKRPIQKVLIGLKTRFMLERGLGVLSTGIPVVSDAHPDPAMRGKVLDPDLPKVVQRCPPGAGWDLVLPYMGVDGWYSSLANFRVALDLYTVNSIGRFGIDCAATAIPCVASDKQDSSRLLWPFTTVDPFVPGPATNFLAKLLSDEDFYQKCLRTADKNLEHYGFAKSKERMMRIMKDA